MPHAHKHKALRSPIGVESLFRVHAYISRQQPRFAGSTLSLPAGRRDADSVRFGRLQQCLSAANPTGFTRAAELEHHALFLRNRFRVSFLRSGTTETLLQD